MLTLVLSRLVGSRRAQSWKLVRTPNVTDFLWLGRIWRRWQMTCCWCQGLMLLVALNAPLSQWKDRLVKRRTRKEALESQPSDGLAYTRPLDLAGQQRFIDRVGREAGRRLSRSLLPLGSDALCAGCYLVSASAPRPTKVGI